MTAQPDAQFFALQEALAGRYSLQSEIGRGGMGVVYLAHDVRLDRPVALKLLPDTLSQQEELRDRFLREARTAAKLSHPNIIPIFSVDEVDRFVFFVMAYVQGESLGQRIRSRGPLPASETARILKEVGWALAYAHERGVIHRDVKPDNILLEDGTNRALVADFGIAGVMEATGAVGIGEIIGTAEFMSPEQASGDGVDGRSDIYSLGVLGFYTLTGTLPFHADTVLEILRKHREEPAPPLSTVSSAVPSRLGRAVDRCLQKDPASRFQSANDVADTMDAALLQRREIPVAVRNFLNDPIDLPGDGPLFYVFTALAIAVLNAAVTSAIGSSSPFVWGVSALMLAPPLVFVVPRVRRLLKSGHGPRDLEAGLKVALERRREELAAAFGIDAPQSERVAYSIGRIAGVSSLASFAALIGLETIGVAPFTYWAALTDVLFGGFITTGLGSFLGFAAGWSSKGRRVDLKAERRYKFWKSRPAKWLFKLCGLGIKRTALPTGLTHRPTELQIGFAAEGLYDDLPRPVRKQLGDVPSVLRGLESDAQRLRETLKALDEAQDTARVAGQPVAGDIAAARTDTEQRLADAVAALESVRLGLLRLSMGAGSVESLTVDLAAASAVGHEIEQLMDGMVEVNALLRPT